MRLSALLFGVIAGFIIHQDSASAVECKGVPGFSDCLIIHGAYGVMQTGLTEADESAGKSASITLPAQRFDFIATSDLGTISDIFSILSPIAITLLSDTDPASPLPPPPSGFLHFVRRGEDHTPFGMFAESDRGEKAGPCGLQFRNVSDCVVFRILDLPLMRDFLPETDESAGLGPTTFPGLVFDFKGSDKDDPGISDRLTISPIFYSLKSDTEDGVPLGPPLPGDILLRGEAARIFNVTVRSDVPEPNSWPIALAIVLAAIDMRLRRLSLDTRGGAARGKYGSLSHRLRRGPSLVV